MEGRSEWGNYRLQPVNLVDWRVNLNGFKHCLENSWCVSKRMVIDTSALRKISEIMTIPKLEDVCKYMNEHCNQNSPDYNIIMGAKHQVIRYDEHTAVSVWECGAIVCIEDCIYFIQCDDGYWYATVYKNGEMTDDTPHHEWFMINGLQGSISLGWAPKFIKAMSDLYEYVKENGKPVYYSGTDEICGYKL